MATVRLSVQLNHSLLSSDFITQGIYFLIWMLCGSQLIPYPENCNFLTA